MKWSETLIPTLKEVPAEAEAISHKLMIRAGLIRKLASGVYSYLPLGLKVLKKIEDIIRQEMNAVGYQEILLPALQPIELWSKTGRDKDMEGDLIFFVDRHGKKVILGPTHEEVITQLVSYEVKSHRQLPLLLYQIQTKFRDEIRPRFGVIRSREFLMKDAYSFDKDEDGLGVSYKKVCEAYRKIFTRCGISYREVEADPGVMGGGESLEFITLSENGEDTIVYCSNCGYTSSFEMGRYLKGTGSQTRVDEHKDLKPLKEVDTPGVTTVEEVGKLLGVSQNNIVKTIIYSVDGRIVAVLVRGDHEVNETKLRKLLECKQLKLADSLTIEKITGAPVGFTGPVMLKDVQIISDYQISQLTDFITGANKKDKHLINVNTPRDFKIDLFADVRYITEKDFCQFCGKNITVRLAIEMGHVFKLGTKYSKSLGASYLDEQGHEKSIIMGCYGIGVSRMVASVIEQSNDENGIIWPINISPFQILILPLDITHPESMKVANHLYEGLLKDGIDVLLDDRDLRAGIKFKDSDLIGIPIRIVISEKSLNSDSLEIKMRKTGEVFFIKCEDVLSRAKELIAELVKGNKNR